MSEILLVTNEVVRQMLADELTAAEVFPGRSVITILKMIGSDDIAYRPLAMPLHSMMVAQQGKKIDDVGYAGRVHKIPDSRNLEVQHGGGSIAEGGYRLNSDERDMVFSILKKMLTEAGGDTVETHMSVI